MALVVVWIVLRIPYAIAANIPGIWSAHVSVLGMSNVRIILPIVWCTLSTIELAYGLRTVIGFFVKS